MRARPNASEESDLRALGDRRRSVSGEDLAEWLCIRLNDGDWWLRVLSDGDSRALRSAVVFRSVLLRVIFLVLDSAWW